MRSKRHKRVLKVALHTAIITVLAVALSNTLVYSFTSMLALKSSVEVKDYQISDLYTVVADKSLPKKNSNNVVLIAVDGLSREQITDVISMVNEASPRAIGVDIMFQYQYDGDSSLIAATSACNTVMTSVRCDDSTMVTSYFCDEAHESRLGFTNLEVTSPIDVVRYYRHKYKVNDSLFNSFATEVTIASGYDIGRCGTEVAYIYYPSLDFWVIEPNMLVEQPLECKEIMKDKIVLIGDMDNMQDMHPTPIGAMSGLQIQASVIETIIGKHNIKCTAAWINWAIAIFSCVLIVLFNLDLSKKKMAIGKLLFRLAQILLLYLFFWAGCMLFAKHNLCVDFAPALSTVAVGLLAYDIYFGLLALYKKIIVKINTQKK